MIKVIRRLSGDILKGHAVIWKLTGPATLANKTHARAVNPLYIIIFDISKIKSKFNLSPVKAKKFLRWLYMELAEISDRFYQRRLPESGTGNVQKIMIEIPKPNRSYDLETMPSKHREKDRQMNKLTDKVNPVHPNPHLLHLAGVS